MNSEFKSGLNTCNVSRCDQHFQKEISFSLSLFAHLAGLSYTSIS